MVIGVPSESSVRETRVAVVPETVRQYKELQATVWVQKGAGTKAGFADALYKAAGAVLKTGKAEILKQADIILRLDKPPLEDVRLLKKGALHLSFLDPVNEPKLVRALARAGVTAVAMELIPRSTRAQKMDALSSQANLAGYFAVILAAERINRIFPMMVTPSGTIAPARVFIIGAGVAGLQAIATAKRLGARVEAYDTRPVVEEQVRSLGARFVKVELGETGQTKAGYAKQLTTKQLVKQQQLIAKYCAMADIVITTAQVFGKKAPVIITKETVKAMKPGSIIVDMAAATGGNVEGSAPDRELKVNGVLILGPGNLPGLIPYDASQMYSQNLYNFLEEFWDRQEIRVDLNRDDEILQACIVSKDNSICHKELLKIYQKKKETR